MKKYSIKGFTKEENEDIVDKYGEWMKPENVVWVEEEYRSALSDKTYEFGAGGVIEISKKIKPKRKNWGNSPRKTLLRWDCWECNPHYSILIGIFKPRL